MPLRCGEVSTRNGSSSLLYDLQIHLQLYLMLPSEITVIHLFPYELRCNNQSMLSGPYRICRCRFNFQRSTVYGYHISDPLAQAHRQVILLFSMLDISRRTCGTERNIFLTVFVRSYSLVRVEHQILRVSAL